MSWIDDIQGYRTILDAAGNPIKRRQTVQILGATAVDDGVKSVITVPPGPTGPTGATPGATALRGAGLTVVGGSALATRIRPRRTPLQDLFITGPASGSTGLGALNWNLLGSGTPAYARQNNNWGGSGGSADISTSGTTNHRSCLLFGDAENRQVVGALDQIDFVQFGFSLPATTTKRVFIGFQSDFATDPLAAADNLGLCYDSAANANWRTISRASSVGTPVSTGVAVSTSQILVTILKNGAVYEFYIANTLVGTVSTGLSTAEMNLGWRVETLAASATSVRLGYFGIQFAMSGGAIDDDNFLDT
jgi:hypothetical protein